MSRIARFCAAAAMAAVLAAPAFANDGFGGLSATGLQFDQTGVVQMLKEDLYISLEKIKVAYVFRHIGDEDLTGEIIFPLPPISLAATFESEFAIPEDQMDKDNLVGFTAKVDGKPVKVKVDRIAVIEPDYDENRPQSASYDTPGKDITATLKKYGIPTTLRWETASAALKKLPQKAKDDLAAQKIASFEDGGDAYPMWSIIERYHWTQTFAAGKDVKIEHSYDGAFPGGIFIWKKKIEPGDYQAELVKKYCVDDGTGKAIYKALREQGEGADKSAVGMAYYIDYVLTTANTWAGPIGEFKLTLDKGNAKNVISLCIDGIKKTGPTTFVSEKKNFTPKDDLSILLVPDSSTLPQ